MIADETLPYFFHHYLFISAFDKAQVWVNKSKIEGKAGLDLPIDGNSSMTIISIPAKGVSMIALKIISQVVAVAARSKSL